MNPPEELALNDRADPGPSGIDLADLSPVLAPRLPDSRGIPRPRLSRQLLQLSSQLVLSSYEMQPEPWLSAGWQDATLMLEGDLFTGFAAQEQSTPVYQRLLADWRMLRVQRRLNRGTPLSELVGALRQRETASVARAMILCKRTPDGRYVIAIGFMGTSQRFYDWFSNLRMEVRDSMHRGFLELAEQFESREDDIQFPRTAAELGLERLTLRMILEECARPGSRFTLWGAGHSLGGALMQIWLYRKITRNGVLPESMVGVTFASPSILQKGVEKHPERYPFYHLMNESDLVPRTGCRVHLGVCLDCPPCEALLQETYVWPMEPEAVAARAAVQPLLQDIRQTPDSILFSIAVLRLIVALSSEELVLLLHQMEKAGRLQPGFLAEAVDNGADRLLNRLIDHFLAGYHSIMGTEAE